MLSKYVVLVLLQLELVTFRKLRVHDLATCFENAWFFQDLGSVGVRMSLENEEFFLLNSFLHTKK
jgi:hypothetical protein